MGNGHGKARSRGPIRIKKFFTDVYGTLIGHDDLTSEQMALEVAERVLARQLDMNPAEFGKVVSSLRIGWAKDKRTPLASQSGPEAWATINVQAFAHFGIPCTKAEGRRISICYTDELDTLRLKKGVREFLNDLLKRGLGERRVGKRWEAYVASNSTVTRIQTALRMRVISSYFRGIITPETIGGIRKPDPDFFRAACDAVGCEPHEAVMMGNSLVNDLGAAAAGLWTIWLGGEATTDALHKAEEIFGTNVGRMVFPCETLDTARETISSFFANP